MNSHNVYGGSSKFTNKLIKIITESIGYQLEIFTIMSVAFLSLVFFSFFSNDADILGIFAGLSPEEESDSVWKESKI